MCTIEGVVRVDLLTSFIIAVGLAMDSFAVSLGVGTSGLANYFKARFRLAFHFGFFQMMMTLLGWLAGSTIANFINGFDHWLALALLGYVGFNMIHSGLNPDKQRFEHDPSRGKTLIMLCVATSLDAMAVGLSLAIVKTPVLLPSIMIGVVTLTLSAVGLLAGEKMSYHFGKKMEIIGGILLLVIGVNIVLTHLFPGWPII